MKFHLTLKSSNAKTGKMPVSTSPKSTCPKSCPFKGNGCYAEGGPLQIHWNKVSNNERGKDWNEFLEQVTNLPSNQVWRHNQAGDLQGNNDKIDKITLQELIKANYGKNGFTYTHYSINGKNSKVNKELIKEANNNGFTINLSAESLEQADNILDLNIGPVVITLPSSAKGKLITPKGRNVILCPATQKESITCVSCKLCAKVNRKSIIGFPAHGFRKNNIDIIVK